MPPDWEAAKLHAEANRVVNASSTNLDLQNPESYCLCCQMPYPADKDFFELCCPDTELGSMGPGFPLFFIFMKYLMVYLFIITLIYFLPISFLISSALGDFDG